MWSTKTSEILAAALQPAGRFAIVGLLASAVHLAVATTLITLGLYVLAANVVGFLVALGVSLVGHHSFSFRSRAPFLQGARRFIPAALAGFLANNLVLALLVATTGDAYAWVNVALAIFVIPPATFCYAYLFAYRG